MALWAVAALAAYFIKGLSGFANTLVFNSILTFRFDSVMISPVELALSYPTCFIMAWRGRESLDRRVVLPLSAMVLAGSAVGAWMLRGLDASRIKVIFGIVVILIGAEMLTRILRPSNQAGRSSGAALAAIGVISGVLSGLFGVGALLAVYVSRTTKDSESFKANLNAVFIVDSTFRMILYIALGIVTWTTVRQALLLSPLMIAGLFAGIRAAKHIDEKRVRVIVSALLVISGVMLIIRNL